VWRDNAGGVPGGTTDRSFMGRDGGIQMTTDYRMADLIIGKDGRPLKCRGEKAYTSRDYHSDNTYCRISAHADDAWYTVTFEGPWAYERAKAYIEWVEGTDE
jgi:hypothetical protein